MFERFSSAARRSMVLAHEEADARGQDFIAPVHLALGIFRADAETSGHLFERLGVGPTFFEELDAEAGSAPAVGGAPRGRPPFTPRAKKALERSLREALDLGQNWIGLGHMLLGVLRAGELNALSDHLPVDVQGLVAGWEADQRAALEVDPRSALRFRLGRRARAGTSPAADDVTGGFTHVVDAARAQTPRPAGSLHLLLAMIEVENTLARKVLDALGVTEAKVRELAESIGAAGTIDAPAPQHVEIRAGGRSVTIDADALRAAIGSAPGEPDKLAELAEKLQEVLEPPSPQNPERG